MKRQVCEMGHDVTVFDSMDELLSFVETPKPKSALTDPELCSSRKVDERAEPWSGVRTFEEAMHLARHGWTDSRPSIDRLLGDIDAKVRSIVVERPVMFHDVAGAFVDIGAYLAGEPECMIEVRNEEVPATGRIVRVLVNGSASSGVQRSNIESRGAAVCALIDAFSRQHLSVEVWVECSIKPKDTARKVQTDRMSVAVKVKAAADPLDIDLLMYPLGNASFLRRVMFDVWERKPARMRKQYGIGGDTSSYYGIPVATMLKDRLEADIVLRNPPEYGSPEVRTPAEWVEHCMRQMGVELRD